MWHPPFLTTALLPSTATHRPWGTGACPTYIRLFKIPDFHCFSSSRLTVSLQESEGRLLLSRKQNEAAKLKRKNVKQHWRQVVRTGPAPGDAWASSSPPTCLKCASGPTQQWQDIAASKRHWGWLVSRKLPIFISQFFILLSMVFNDLRRTWQADPSYSSCHELCALSSVGCVAVHSLISLFIKTKVVSQILECVSRYEHEIRAAFLPPSPWSSWDQTPGQAKHQLLLSHSQNGIQH